MNDPIDDHPREVEDLRESIENLDEKGANRATPAAGWTIADQIWHLAYFEGAAADAIERPEHFNADHGDMYASDPAHHTESIAELGRGTPVDEIVAAWLRAHEQFCAAIRGAEPRQRVPWYGVDMTVRSMATARLMETWAHGLDVTDALQIQPIRTDRLQHVAFLGCRAMAFSFDLNGRPVPAEGVSVRLRLPSGEEWSHGPEDALNRVKGEAFDFCAVITQRRHRDDTTLDVVGTVAEEWLDIGQAFAGVPGTGRPAGWHVDPHEWM